MRLVERTLDPGQSWLEDAARTTPIQPGHKARSDIYAHDDVWRACLALFGRKCAYCEALGAIRIDHFRPWGAVAEEPTHPGYYWLAHDWSNLYPACPICNEPQRDYDAVGSQFPLTDPATRVWAPGSIELEARLLLDPCKDNPRQHLRLDATGELEGLTHLGKKSIDVLNLNFTAQTQRRVATLRHLLKAIVDDDLTELKDLLSTESEYCGLLKGFYELQTGLEWPG